MALYLKYRPQKIGDLDLVSVRELLGNIIASGNIAHAFLFSGPKGTGKTSAARIMAKVVNCTNRKEGSIEPCDRCSQCESIKNAENIDVLEIDAASHRGIDDVRALRDAVKLAPASASKKVYIIDEAHMLTTEASNALLKTLEEPPEHVMFILATTNPEKLISTVRSRATNVKFAKATIEEITRSLGKKVKGEKLKAEKGALELIAKAADHSFRDADKILDQLITEKIKLTNKAVSESLFHSESFDLDKLIIHLYRKNAKKAILEVEKAVKNGASIKIIIEETINRLRELLLVSVGVNEGKSEEFSSDELSELMRLFTSAAREVSDAYIEQIPMELAIVDWCNQKDGSSEGSESTNGESDQIKEEVAQRSKTKNPTVKKKTKFEKSDDPFEARVVDAGFGGDIWGKILSAVRPVNSSTEALLRATKPVQYSENTLTLGVYYNFHKEKLECNPHRDVLEGALRAIMGCPVKVICTLTSPPKRAHAEKEDEVVLTESEDEDIIKVAKEIFGN